jgi:3-methyladenine DNA glycosylase AlkD
MDFQETMRELELLGSEQTRKTFLRHGAPGPLFGVKFGDLEKLRKRIKTNPGLAEALWDSGNSDARMLATLVADAPAMSRVQLDAWARALNWHTLVDVFVSNVMVRSPHAREVLEAWAAEPGEMQGRAGWALLSALAAKTDVLKDEELVPWLPRIEQGIHAAPNRVREAMNTALIAIGGRGGQLQAQALEVARRIGKVEVFHGDTACKTPDAVEYIAKVRAHKAGAAGRAAALAKGAVDGVKGAAKRAAAGAQNVATGAMSAVANVTSVVSGAKDAVTNVTNVMSGAKDGVNNVTNMMSGAKDAVTNVTNLLSDAKDAVTSATHAVSDVAKNAVATAKQVASGVTPRALMGAKGNGARKQAPAKKAVQASVKKAAPAAKKAPAKRAAPAAAKEAATKRGAAKKAAPAKAKRAAPAAAKKAAPAAAKKAAPAAAKKAAKRAAPAAAKKAPARGGRKTAAKKGARSRA